MSTSSTSSRGPELQPGDWAAFFEALNRRLEEGARVEVTIEIVDDPSEGTEAERLPLNSITHEDGDDQIAIGVGGRDRRYPAVLWHYVDRPRHVWVTGDGAFPSGIIIESEDEALTLVRLHQP
jgi:uncharacterized protein DUF5335